MWLLAKLTGPLRKWLMLAGAMAITFLVVALKAYNAGVSSAKTKQAQKSLDNLRRRMKVNAKVDSADDAAVRDKLRDEWSDE